MEALRLTESRDVIQEAIFLSASVFNIHTGRHGFTVLAAHWPKRHIRERELYTASAKRTSLLAFCWLLVCVCVAWQYIWTHSRIESHWYIKHSWRYCACVKQRGVDMGAGLIGDVRIAVSQSSFAYTQSVFGFRSMNDIHMYLFGYRHTFTYSNFPGICTI